MRRRERNRVMFSAGSRAPMYAFDPSAPPPPPLAETLAVFRRPRREEDEPPEPIVSLGRSPEPSEAPRAREDEALESTLPLSYRLPLPGRARRRERLRASFAYVREAAAVRRRGFGLLIDAESRLLVGPVGARGYRLFATPTTTGVVVFSAFAAVGPAGGGQFTSVLPHGFTWHMSWRTRADGVVELIAHGLLADDVEAVQVEIGRERYDAVVGENGFLYETSGIDPEDVRGFVLGYRDGTSRHVGTPE